VSRVALFVFLVFFLLALLRLARPLLHAGRARFGRSVPRPHEAEMVRDPICGTWIDRRLALMGRRGGETVSVCSEKCLRELESA